MILLTPLLKKRSLAAKKKDLLAIRRKEKIIEEKKLAEKYSKKFTNTSHTIVIGDSRKMRKIQDESIHLIITSPPYFNAKKYAHWNSLNEYLSDMEKTFKECYRILQSGRKFCLNVSDIPEKGKSGVRWIALGAELLKVCQNVGFELVDRVFWFKTPLKGFQYGSLPYPPSPLINDSIEYVFVLRKPGKSDYTYLSKEKKQASKLTRDEYMEYTKQIWSIRRVREKENQDGHIAPFPEELPARCIKLYSFVNDIVLDPFGGRGTTMKTAIDNKRNSIIYEIKKDYLPMIKDMIDLKQKKLDDDYKVVIKHEK